MKEVSLPYDLVTYGDSSQRDVHLIRYDSDVVALKTRITLHCYLFSFLLEGTKNVAYSDGCAEIDPSQFLLLSAGNCLMSEKTAPEAGKYRSILMPFSNKVLSEFFSKHPATASATVADGQLPFLVCKKDEFLAVYIHSLVHLSGAGKNIPESMLLLKLEELLMYLSITHPHQMATLRQSWLASEEDQRIRSAVATHAEGSISVEELAFLCNMSLSTFKRRFARIYHTSPNKYLLQKRMDMAAGLLRQGSLKASDIYYQVGYENLSSFVQSFKQVHGVTPKKYQSAALNV